MHRVSLPTFAALAALCLLGAISPAHAIIDMALNTTNYNPQQTSSTLSVDATVTEDGPSWGILCALVWLRFDPSKVTISSLQGAGANGWFCSAYNLDHVSEGWASAIFLNSGDSGQTTSGAIGTFTVTPANSQVDVNDCDTLRLDGDSSELCDQDYYLTYPSDPCNGRDYPISDNPGEESIPVERGGGMGPMSPDIDLSSVVKVLRIAGGLDAATQAESQTLDWTRDGKVTIVDAIQIARTPGVKVVSILPFDDELDASPAVYDMNGDGLPEVAIAQAQYLYQETINSLSDPANHNKAYLFEWNGTDIQPLPGWPQRLRDAPPGIAIGDIGGTFRVAATCSQDNYADFKPSGWPDQVAYFTSREYVWNRDGSTVESWAPWSLLTGPDTGIGLVWGHQLATAPMVYRPGIPGATRIVQASQGVFAKWDIPAEYNNPTPSPAYYRYGSLKIWSGAGALLHETSTTGGTDKLLITDEPKVAGSSNFSISIPPVVATLSGNAGCIVTATEDGRLYAWDSGGGSISGWYPSANGATQTEAVSGPTMRAPVTQYNSMAAVDFDGDGNDDIVLTTGDYRSDYSYGKVYRFSSAGGAPAWSYPSGTPTAPAMSSGIAIGRIRPGYPTHKCLVVGDQQGHIIALDPNLASGQNPVIWSVSTAGTIYAEPTIGDVNNDGYQDVVVGGSDGYIYALDGDSGSLIWKIRTPNSTIQGITYHDIVTASPALARLADDGHIYVIAASFTRTYDAVTKTFPSAGHLMVIDSGPIGANTVNDWPQYQHDAQRSGNFAPLQ